VVGEMVGASVKAVGAAVVGEMVGASVEAVGDAVVGEMVGGSVEAVGDAVVGMVDNDGACVGLKVGAESTTPWEASPGN
jgi:hypothetical protein